MGIEELKLANEDLKNSGYYCPYCDSEDCSGCGESAYESGYEKGLAKVKEYLNSPEVREDGAKGLHEIHKTHCKRFMSWDMRDTEWEELDGEGQRLYRSAFIQILKLLIGDS